MSTILRHTKWTKLYLIKPESNCSGSYGDLLNYLTTYVDNMTVLPSDPNMFGFDHFLYMVAANNIIIDKYSTYSFWAAFFSNASKIHVDVSHHSISNNPKYIYHNEMTHQYFGYYTASKKKSKSHEQQATVKSNIKYRYNHHIYKEGYRIGATIPLA
jgi:hypothetical protein